MAFAAFTAPQYTQSAVDGLDGMTKAQLLDIAESLGLQGVKGKNKADIIDAIREVMS